MAAGAPRPGPKTPKGEGVDARGAASASDAAAAGSDLASAMAIMRQLETQLKEKSQLEARVSSARSGRGGSARQGASTGAGRRGSDEAGVLAGVAADDDTAGVAAAVLELDSAAAKARLEQLLANPASAAGGVVDDAADAALAGPGVSKERAALSAQLAALDAALLRLHRDS